MVYGVSPQYLSSGWGVDGFSLQHFWDSSVSPHVAVVCSFPLLYGVPLFEYTTVDLPIILLTDIWVVSRKYVAMIDLKQSSPSLMVKQGTILSPHGETEAQSIKQLTQCHTCNQWQCGMWTLSVGLRACVLNHCAPLPLRRPCTFHLQDQNPQKTSQVVDRDEPASALVALHPPLPPILPLCFPEKCVPLVLPQLSVVGPASFPCVPLPFREKPACLLWETQGWLVATSGRCPQGWCNSGHGPSQLSWPFADDWVRAELRGSF